MTSPVNFKESNHSQYEAEVRGITETHDEPPKEYTALDVFHRFSSLPPELRVQIWELSAPPPQSVAIWIRERPIYMRRSGEPGVPRALRARYKLPSMLHSNQESRAVAKTIYTNEFAERFCGGLWMDISKDILFFSHKDAWRVFFGYYRTKYMKLWPKEWRNPLTKQLPALAFTSYCNPRLLTIYPHQLFNIGQPKIIYNVEPGKALWHKVPAALAPVTSMFWDRHLAYKRPKLITLTEEDLSSLLAASAPPIPKPKRKHSKIAKAFLKNACQPVL